VIATGETWLCLFSQMCNQIHETLGFDYLKSLVRTLRC
jgi:hypothetical protein